MNNECVICLEDISNESLIILECCKNNIHFECLKDWLITNINIISDIDKCFFCKNDNQLISDLIYNIKTIDNNIIQDNNNDNNNDNNDNDSNTRDCDLIINRYNTDHNNKLSCMSIICIICIAGIVIFLFFFTHKLLC